MYVETDFLFNIAKPDDWLTAEAEAALNRWEVYTSLLAYAEFLVAAYRTGEGFEFDVPRTVADMLESVPIRPERDEEALLAAAIFLDEHDMTPFDAIHAGIAATHEGRILSSNRSYDGPDVERIPLEPDAGPDG